MFKLLKGGHCFTPNDIGMSDVLVVWDKVGKIEKNIREDGLWDVEVIDCRDKIVCPGFVDQHVHITGGGGEEGPVSRIPELMMGDIIAAGVSTVVGVLGVDGVTRNIEMLLAKARALEIEGVSTYIYTGSYGVPTATLTGRVLSDIVLLDKVIGVGEIAIADHRSSHPTLQMLKEIAYQARVGGMVGGKAGVVHIHVGEGKEGIKPLFELTGQSDFPADMFVPTHLNRTKELFAQAVEYVKKGGLMDLTAGEKTDRGYSVPDALEIAVNSGIDMERVTVSSDGNGSIPAGEGNGTGIGLVSQLFDDIRESILVKKLDTGVVLKTVTENVARILKLLPRKGTISVGCDADILILNKIDLSLDGMLVKGEIAVSEKKIIKKGRYEKG